MSLKEVFYENDLSTLHRRTIDGKTPWEPSGALRFGKSDMVPSRFVADEPGQAQPGALIAIRLQSLTVPLEMTLVSPKGFSFCVRSQKSRCIF